MSPCSRFPGTRPRVLERRFSPGIRPEEAVMIAADLVHDDYAYIFDAYWDLWTPDAGGQPVEPRSRSR